MLLVGPVGGRDEDEGGSVGRVVEGCRPGGDTIATEDTDLYTVLYTNARSIINKCNELCVVSYEERPDFILICESFCNENHSDALLKVPGSQLVVRKDGSNQGRARGLLIYAKEEIKTVRLNLELLDRFEEGAGISVPWFGGRLSLVLAYRPPRHPGSVDDNGNTEKLVKLIRCLQGPVLMCGDLNLPDVSWDKLSAPAGVQQQVLDAVQDKFWTQVVDFPTHQAGRCRCMVVF